MIIAMVSTTVPYIASHLNHCNPMTPMLKTGKVKMILNCLICSQHRS